MNIDWTKKYPKEIDLTNEKHSEYLFEAVSELLEDNVSFEDLQKYEADLSDKYEDNLILPQLAVKIAKSKLLAQKIEKPIFVSVVFAVYMEHTRIKTNKEHIHGENFLIRKVEQMKWLFADQDKINWEIVVVDDGCPENSGQIAQEIIDKNQLNNRVRVLFLDDAIRNEYLPAKGLKSTKDSQKGGSILYGMWDAALNNSEGNKIIVFTDADLSTHLGQLMLLIDPIINENMLSAIGSRREKNSVVIKKGSRNNRGKMFIYLWKRLIPNLGNIIDTQCGFKAFDARIVPQLVEDMIEKKFAFDIELLLKTQIMKPDSIKKVGIAWIDSEAASTTTDIQPYLPMLKAIVKMYRMYFPLNTLADQFADFLENMTEEQFQEILNHIPQEIIERDPSEFSTFDEVLVSDFMIDKKV